VWGFCPGRPDSQAGLGAAATRFSTGYGTTSSCACVAADHPGHGPYYAFTTKVAGKTKTVQLRAGSRLNKFQREVDAYKRFRALSEKLIEVNQALCEARPEPDAASQRSALKKTSRRSSRRRSARK
jgi:hypothetical protein